MPQSGVGNMLGSKGRTHTRGGTHPQCNPTNGHKFFFGNTKQTNEQTKRTKHILRQHAT